MTQQPDWEKFFEADEFTAYRDKTGVYDVEMEYRPEGENLKYRIMCERFKRFREHNEDGSITEYLVCDSYQPEWPHPTQCYTPWFSVREVADACGIHPYKFADLLCGSPEELIHAYMCLIDYYGAIEFDSYPVAINDEE